MTLAEIQKSLNALKNKGFINSRRRGPTGVGYTLEHELGLKETNIPMPDIGGRVELKAMRKNSSSLITLFTFNKAVWKIPQDIVIKNFGYLDKNGRNALYNTIWNGTENSQGLSIILNENDNIIGIISNKDDLLVAEWNIYNLLAKFISKFEKLIIVMADTKKTADNIEQFHFNEAYYLENPTAKEFLKSFKNGTIGIDIRMHMKSNGIVRNHGTGIRVYESKIRNLFGTTRTLI